jgi:hypothetical protein
MTVATLLLNAMADLFDDYVNAGSSFGTLEIRTGSAPAATTDGDSGTLLATNTFSDPAFGAASGGVITASAISDDADIDATNTAAHFRIKDSNGLVVAQGTVGTSGADINFNSVSFVEHGRCIISSLTVTVVGA